MNRLPHLLLLLSLPAICQSLASRNPLDQILSKAGQAVSSKNQPSKADGDRLLKELNLEASTEPKLAYAETKDIPSLLAASVTPVLRAASGVFAQDYKLELIPVDPTKYSYLPPFNDRQLLESGIYKAPNEPLRV
jgi:hypothetical protein